MEDGLGVAVSFYLRYMRMGWGGRWNSLERAVLPPGLVEQISVVGISLTYFGVGRGMGVRV